MTTYSFLSITASIRGPGGAFNIGSSAGVAEEGITVENIEEKDDMKVGADGAIMHSLRASNAGRLTLRLLKTSPINGMLSQMYNFQRQNPSNWGQNVIAVNDIYRGDVETCTEMAFAKQTGNTYAKDANMNEWMFQGNRESQLGFGVPDINV